MIVTTSDFSNKPYRLNNIEENKDFRDFMEAEEQRILEKILGVALYDELVEAFDVADPPVIAKWANLVNGTAYDYSGHQYRYSGLLPILQARIYSLWLVRSAHKQTSAGVVVDVPADKNSSSVGPRVSASQASADFTEKCGNCYRLKNTLYGFLHANLSTYSNWNFVDPGSVNRFDL